MNDDLEKIVANMVKAGESEDNIALVIKHYNEVNKAVKTEPSSVANGLSYANDLAAGAERSFASTLASVPKALGHGSEWLERKVLGTEHKSPFTSLGETIEEGANNFTQTPTLDQTAQTLPGQVAFGLGTVGGMLAGGEIGALGKTAQGLALTNTVVPSAGRLLAGQLTKPISVIGGTMTGVPEYEAAKAAGKSDDEAFSTMMKNYLVGQTEAIPLEAMFTRLNRITGGGIINNLKKYASGVIQGGLSEAAQEGVQTYLTNRIAEADYDPDRDPLFGVADAMTSAGIVGMLIPGIGGAIRSASPDNKIKLQKKIVDLQAKTTALQASEEAIGTSDTGNPEINTSIDDEAKLSPEEMRSVQEKKVSEMQSEEAIKKTEERAKEIEKIEGDLDKHEVAKKKSEEGKGTLIPEQKREMESRLEELRKEHENGPEQQPEDREALKQQALDNLNAVADLDIANSSEEEKQQAFSKLQQARTQLSEFFKPRPKSSGIKERINDTTGVTPPEKTIHLTPGQAIKKQMQDFYKGVGEGVKRGNDLIGKLLTKVQEALKGAQMTNAQTRAILGRVKRTNLSTPGSVSELGDYVAKVADDAQYAEKLGQAAIIRKRLRAKKSSETLTHSQRSAIGEFAKVDPEEVDIDKYLETGDHIAQSFQPVAKRSVMNLQKVNNYVASVKPQMDAANAKRDAEKASREHDRILNMAVEMGVTPERAADLMKEENDEKDEAADKHLRSIAEETKSRLPEDGDNENETKDLNTLKEADLSLLTSEQVKQFIRTADRIAENGDFGGVGKLAATIRASEEFKEMMKKLKNANILNLVGFEDKVSSLPVIMQSIFGLSQDASEFQKGMSMNAVNGAFVHSEEEDMRFVDQINSLKGKKDAGFTDESIFRQAIYSELIRYNEDIDPLVALAQTKQIIEQDIQNHIDKGKSKEADTIRNLYAPFRDAKTIEEVQAAMERIDPVGKSIISKAIELYKPYGQKLADYNNRYHNVKTVNSVNYSGPRVWISDGAQNPDEMPIGEIGDVQGYSSLIPKPRQVSTAKEFKNQHRTDALLNYNKHTTMNNGFRKTVFAIEGIEPMIKVREKIKQREKLEQFFGAKAGNDESIQRAKKLYSTLFGKGGLYTEFEDQIAGRKVPEKFDQQVSAILNPLRKLGYALSLSGFSQIPKQATVLANTMIQLGKDTTLLPIRELLFADKKTSNAFFAGHTINLRGSQKSQFSLGDLTDPKTNSEFNKGVSKLIDRGFEGIFGLKPLVKTDVAAARLTYLAFYKSYLKSKGVEYKGMKQESAMKDKTRESAHAYAKHRTDVLQGVSNPAEMGTLIKDQRVAMQMVKAWLIPFGTFSSNTKSRMWADTKNMITGNSAQRKAAARDFIGTAAEQAMFHATSGAMKIYLWGGLGYLLRDLFDLPEDKKREKDAWPNAVASWKAKMYFDMLPVILTDPLQKAITEGINMASDRLFNYKNAIYNPKPARQTEFEKMLGMGGVYGVAVDRIVKMGSLAGDVTSGEKGDKHLTDEQRRFAAWVLLAHAANTVGAFPSDVIYAIDNEYNHTKPGKRRR